MSPGMVQVGGTVQAALLAILLAGFQLTAFAEVCDVVNTTQEESLRLCEGGSGTLLPLFPTWESQQSRSLRVVVYLVGLLWCFAGVALLADAFMGAIEVITSKEVIRNDGVKDIKVLVWNPTVANLTLMALGSSAPEIVLAIIEIAANDMYTGELGPSTIVGSAAFNLLVILGICMVSIPTADKDPHGLGYRRVKQKTVLLITSLNSVFAYIWLLVILMGTSPDLIEPWEGVMTFMFCPIMVIIAYLADKGYFTGDDSERVDPGLSAVTLGSANVSEEDVFRRLKQFSKDEQVNVSSLDEELAVDLLTQKEQGNVRQTRALRRRGVMMSMLRRGQKAITFGSLRRRIDVLKAMQNAKKMQHASVGFESTIHVVQENVQSGVVKMRIVHTAGSQAQFTVDYATKDGDATAGRKYRAKSGTLTFDPGTSSHEIEIGIIDNDIEEADEFFSVALSNLVITSGFSDEVKISQSHNTAIVTILDDDKPGQIVLAEKALFVNESSGDLPVVLQRKMGCKGSITCVLKTTDGSAVSPHDYEGLGEDGLKVVFEDGQTERTIHIKIVDDEMYEKDEHFTINLEAGAGESPDTVGDPKFSRVTIISDDKLKGIVARSAQLLNFNRHRFAVGTSVWGDQIWEAVRWPDEDDGKAAIVIHIILFVWKLWAALVPPTFWFGGKLAFFVALLYIAIVTAVIGDLAGMFGCAIGLSDAVTAITFVALGTSLPDTFASRTAAVQDKSADAAIGNVTGSNAVNVYLGLGLPWMVASIYWRLEGATCDWQARYPDAIKDYKNGGFYVPAGELGFTVGLFCAAAACSFSILLWRRASGAELGSSGNGSGSSIGGFLMISLWVIFVVVSSLRVEKMI